MPAAPEHAFNFARYWQQGDALSHAVAYVLLAMSLASWCLIFAKVFSNWRIRRAAPAIDAFWAAPSVRDGVALLALADREEVFAPLPTHGLAHTMGTRSVAGEMGRAEQVVRVLRQQINRSTERL